MLQLTAIAAFYSRRSAQSARTIHIMTDRRSVGTSFVMRKQVFLPLLSVHLFITLDSTLSTPAVTQIERQKGEPHPRTKNRTCTCNGIPTSSNEITRAKNLVHFLFCSSKQILRRSVCSDVSRCPVSCGPESAETLVLLISVNHNCTSLSLGCPRR